MGKSKRAKIDDKILSDIANKLKFADECICKRFRKFNYNNAS